MDNKDFFEQIKEDYFICRSVSIDNLKEMISGVMHVFGKLKTEIETNEDGEVIIEFIDEDKANMIFTPKIQEITEEDTDMSDIFLKITVNKDNEIILIKHGLNIFTPANKEIVLFLSSLINKKIIF